MYVKKFDLNYSVMFKGINAIQFDKGFFDNEVCYLYLIEQKCATDSNVADVHGRCITKAKRFITANASGVFIVKV